MERVGRFRAGGWEGYGLFDGDTVYETQDLLSRERGVAHPAAGVELLAPCLPSKIVCVGRNYLEHAAEFNNPVPAEPLIFLKPPSALNRAGGPIVCPRISQRVDYEAELGLVIGRRAKDVPRERAWDYVFGFTCVNDVTARDLQRKDGQWTRGKGCDTFCPAGPWIVRKEDVDFASLHVRAYLNGALVQDAPVTEMIFPVDAIIAYVTEFMTLEPGDLIATGTPSGVGPMLPGAQVAVEIEGIGRLENPVI